MRKVWIILLALFFLLTGSARAQEPVTIQPGDSLLVFAADVPPEIIIEIDSIPFPVYDCPPDFLRTDMGAGWSCTPPEPTATYAISVSAIRNDRTGDLEVPAGDYYVHLDRLDGAWDGSGFVRIAGVDSVVFVLDGQRNRERNYPYEVRGGQITLAVGEHSLTWEVFGDEPDSGASTVTVVGATLDAKIEECLVLMRDSVRGIYYSPAADACVRLGDVPDRLAVNTIHAAYWRARDRPVNDNPFPGTVGDLTVDSVGFDP